MGQFALLFHQLVGFELRARDLTTLLLLIVQRTVVGVLPVLVASSSCIFFLFVLLIEKGKVIWILLFPLIVSIFIVI